MKSHVNRADLTAALTLSVEEYAAAVSCSKNTAYDQIKSGEVPSIRLGRKLRIPASHVRRILGIGEPNDVEVLR